MKGQQQAVSAILITGILIAVVGSVYFWGIPLIQKNKDISLLESSEVFILNVNNKIKDIANHGGKDMIAITTPGILKFDGENITLEIDTTGSIYDVNAMIPLSKNSCTLPNGVWGVDNPEVICIITQCTGSGKCENYHTIYKLNYIRLDVEPGIKSYQLELTGNKDYGGEHNYIQIENKGTTEETAEGRNLISTKIAISII
jgi:hypothetical protein